MAVTKTLEEEYIQLLSCSTVAIVFRHAEDFPSTIWTELLTAVETLYNSRPQALPAARQLFNVAVQRLQANHGFSYPKIRGFLEALALRFMSSLKSQLYELIKQPKYDRDKHIMLNELLRPLRNTRAIYNELIQIYDDVYKMGLNYNFVQLNEVLFKEVILDDEKIANYLNLSHVDNAENQTEDTEAVKRMHSRWPYFKSQIALFHFIYAKKIDGPACVQQFAKQWSDLINHTKCTPTFDTDYRPEYDPANISHGKHANERLVEGPRSTKRKKNRRNKAPTQPEAKPENPIAPATQSRGSHDPANMISSLTLPLGIPAEFPQFWTEETSDPEIDREVELFTRKLEDHSKAIASTDGKTIKICLRQQSYEQLAGWSRTHSMNMFKHLYQLPGQ